MTHHPTPLTTCPDWCTSPHGPEELSHATTLAKHGEYEIDIVQDVDITDDNHLAIRPAVANLVLDGETSSTT